jgi:hypothetical protein
VAHPEVLAKAKDQLQLHTPIFELNATTVSTAASASSTSGSAEKWAGLEMLAFDLWDRKGKKPMRLLPDDAKVVASVGGESQLSRLIRLATADVPSEVMHVELLAVNPLNCPLSLSNLHITTDCPDDVSVKPISDVQLEPYESLVILAEITANKPTTFTVTSVEYVFHQFFPCSQLLARKGKRLNATKAHRLTATYAADTSLTVTVEPSRPSLRASFQGLPHELYEGEEVEGVIQLENVGKVAVDHVQFLANVRGVVRIKPPGRLSTL